MGVVKKVFCLLLCTLLWMPTAYPVRVKDITSIAGIRENQLVGYGLVVGLNGTGDRTNQTPFTDQTFQNMLLQFGIRIPFGKATQLKNVAAVAIGATLPPFAKIGQKIDITVLSLGNAVSLRGGSLLMAPLKGADGKVYAIAQGNVVVSGFGAQGADGSKVVVNVTSSGTIPNGATVENIIDTPFVDRSGAVTFELLHPDFTTAERIEQAINGLFGSKIAQALDASMVRVKLRNLPYHERCFEVGNKCGVHFERDAYLDDIGARRRYVSLIARIQNIHLTPADVAARVIVNSRTGTIVIGQHVTIHPVAVSHGNLSVVVNERPFVSQPQGFSRGKTVVGKASDININQEANKAFLFAPGASLTDMVAAINLVGAAPGDLIAILEAIKSAGSLDADLEVI